MSIRDFHSKFVSGSERNRLFVALRRLSLLQDLRSAFAADPAQDQGWPIWEGDGAPAGAGH